MAITFLEMAELILEEVKQPMTASEIWKYAVSKGYEKKIVSNGKTPWATLGALIYVDVRDNNNSVFYSIGSRPKKFFIKKLISTISDVVPDIPPINIEKSSKYNFLEKDLHPLMVYYGSVYLKAFLKTIDHSKSEKKSFGEWVHPDIVGCYFPYSDWENEVVEVSSLLGDSSIKLFSFELKREITFSNLRESFFQAVSNSSWANEGYLVASYIDIDEDFRNELSRLSTSFGIGIIELNIEDPDSSEILYPATAKEFIDWETVNKLVQKNADFTEFIQRIRNDMKNREIRKERYDKVLEKDEIIKNLSKSKKN